MERLDGEEIGQRASIRQVALASFIGTAIEWYDFFLYGTAAALVFNQLFFPNLVRLTGTLASFATFGVGFFARRVGGLQALRCHFQSTNQPELRFLRRPYWQFVVPILPAL
jgi:MFS transporter, MHS family, shikimate and dehydroshikimate transport protein